MRRFLLVFVIGFLVSGCASQPHKTCEVRNLRCSPDGFCSWTDCDGSLVFGVVR